MADYIYLLQTRLTPAQFAALNIIRETAKSRDMNIFLVGGAVRDLTSGSPIRDLDFAIQGNATKLKKELQKAGGILTGESELTQALYFSFPGGVRLEVGSTLTATYPKPGKPVYKAANILEDLRRRDFTANAMAISLNDGSYGLLMDPLNGVADLENMELRLVSNYGFIEDPVRMIRASRLSARLGWHMEEKTQQRYETGKAEGYISALSPWLRGYETEEILHEEDPLRVLRRLEHDGWSKFLFPAWTAAKANEAELNRLRDIAGQLQSMGIHPDPSAAYFPLLTAKLAPKDVSALKKSFARTGVAAQIDGLDSITKAFAADFSGKAAAVPSDAWKMIYAAIPEAVLSLAFTSKSAPVQARFKAFFNDWPTAKQRIPYQIMQEMRIVPSLPIYDELLHKLEFAIMDGKLDTPEATKAFLEPFSPPAPPPPVSLRRRPVKRETKPAKPKKAAKKVAIVEPSINAAAAAEVPAPAPVKVAAKPVPAKVPAKVTPVKAVPVKTAKATVTPVKAPAKKAAAKPVVKKIPVKAAAKKIAAKKAVTKKAIAKPAKKAVAKKAAPAKAVAKKAPAKKVAAKKVVAKKVVAKKAQAKKAPVKKAAVKKAPAKPVKKAAKPLKKATGKKR